MRAGQMESRNLDTMSMKSISLVLKSSEKYMLLVGQLYGKKPNDVLHNTDVGKDDALLSKESSKSSMIRRNAIL